MGYSERISEWECFAANACVLGSMGSYFRANVYGKITYKN